MRKVIREGNEWKLVEKKFDFSIGDKMTFADLVDKLNYKDKTKEKAKNYSYKNVDKKSNNDYEFDNGVSSVTFEVDKDKFNYLTKIKIVDFYEL